jgi:hypothetical protein
MGMEYKWNDNILTKSFVMTADGITLRLVEKSDSKFVLDLRNDKKLGQNISFTSPDIDDQINWIEEYKKREISKEEFYFIFEDSSHQPWGTVRLYNLTSDSFTIGSWICKEGNKDKIAIKAWLKIVEFGFNELNYKTCLFDIRKKNFSVLYFAYLFQPKCINENELDYYFSLDKGTFYKNLEKVTMILNLKA